MNSTHYPSLELCKKLTEDGFPETYLSMISWVIQEKRGVSSIEYFQGVVPLVCPSVMELLDELPTFVAIEKEDNWTYSCYKFDFTPSYNWALPNALAEMWLWLKENNYLKHD